MKLRTLHEFINDVHHNVIQHNPNIEVLYIETINYVTIEVVNHNIYIAEDEIYSYHYTYWKEMDKWYITYPEDIVSIEIYESDVIMDMLKLGWSTKN